MICNKCGREIEKDAKFCVFCGSPVTVDKPEDVVTTGAPLDETAAMVATEGAAATAGEIVTDATAVTVSADPATIAAEPGTTDWQSSINAPAATPDRAPLTAEMPTVDSSASTTVMPAGSETQPMQQYSAPLPGQDSPYVQTPYGATPTAQGGLYGAGAQGAVPQYGTPVGQTPQEPKKKKTWIIILVVALIVVLCGAVSVGGYFMYQAFQESTATDVTTPANDKPSTDDRDDTNIPDDTDTPDDTDITNEKPDTNDSDANDDNDIPATTTGNVIIETANVKVTFEVGSAQYDSTLDWYEVTATVENKTDKEIDLYFDSSTTSIDGLAPDGYIVIIPDDPDVFLVSFPPGSTDALIVISDTTDDALTNFKGSLRVVDSETFDEIESLPFNIAKLG